MKYVKMLGLLAVAAAALMAFAGTASATLTNLDKTNTTEIHAESSHTQLTGSLTVTCKKSTVAGTVTTNDANHASGPITALTFEECGVDTVTVLVTGSLTLTEEDGTVGTVFSTGAEVTVLTHRPFLGTVHCIYTTNNTHIGTFTESDHTPAGGSSHTTATLHANSQSLNRKATDFGCGEDSTWDGTYETTKHVYLD